MSKQPEQKVLVHVGTCGFCGGPVVAEPTVQDPAYAAFMGVQIKPAACAKCGAVPRALPMRGRRKKKR